MFYVEGISVAKMLTGDSSISKVCVLCRKYQCCQEVNWRRLLARCVFCVEGISVAKMLTWDSSINKVCVLCGRYQRYQDVNWGQLHQQGMCFVWKVSALPRC